MTSTSLFTSANVRGTAVVRVLGEDGQVKQEVEAKNITMRGLWDSLFFQFNSSSRDFMGSTYTYYPHIYISANNSVPNPYESNVTILGEGTNHPSGHYSLGAEEVTTIPYFEFHNLFQVTGGSRTVYSVGLLGRVSPGSRTNDYPSGSTKDYPMTRALLPEAVTQGPTDQLDITYRLYVEQEPGDLPTAGFWAYVMDWAFTRTSNQDYGSSSIWYDRKMILGLAGVGNSFTPNTLNLPSNVTSNNTQGYSTTNHLIRHYTFNEPDVDTFNKDTNRDLYRWGWRYDTNRDYMWGLCFNEWWNFNYDARASSPYWLGADQGWPGTTVKWSGHHLRTAFNYADLTALSSPFKNSYNHSASSLLTVYDISGLPLNTWRATFGGTWPSSDRLPMFSRVWYSEGGPMDGTAKYKMAFMRSMGQEKGQLYSESGTRNTAGIVGFTPTGQKGYQYADDSSGYIGRKTYGLMQWQKETDLIYGHTEWKDSRWGNLGLQERSGWSGVNDTSEISGTSGYPDGGSYKWHWDMKKYPGLRMDSWWGYQSGKKGKTSFLGVEWRRTFPLQRVVWQAADIDPGLTQIDYLEPVHGIAGEVDEEMALICDATSGIYLLNATQNTVTKITSELGFIKCSTNRELDGSFTYTGIKKHEDPDIRVTLHDQNSGYDGTAESVNDRYWQNITHGPDGRKAVIHPLVDYATTCEPDLSDDARTATFYNDYAQVRRASFGFFGNSFVFNGNNNGNDSAFNGNNNGKVVVDGTGLILDGDFTIECWLLQEYRTSNRGTLYEFGQYNDGGILMRLGTNNNQVYSTSTARGTLASYSGNSSADIGDWRHFVHERVGGVNTVYINGVSQLSWTDAAVFNSAEKTLTIGGRYSTTSDSFNGYISDFRISTVARYNGTVTVPTAAHPIGAADPQWSSVKLLLRGYGDRFGTITGGSNYLDGSHTVALTGGTGTDATAYIKVAGGAVERVSIINGGGDYTIGDVLTGAVPAAPNPNLGAVLTLTGLVGGSGYADGSYPGVQLTSGTGSGAAADITVTGGVVTAVTLTAGGTGYTAGDVLSAADSSLGNLGTGAGFTITADTVDEAAELTPTPWSITLETLRTPVPTMWESTTRQGGLGRGSNELILWRRHYRFPHIGIGINATDTNYPIYPWVWDFRRPKLGFDPNGRGWWTTGYTYPESEFFGYDGEDQSTVETVRVDAMRRSHWIRHIWPTWVSMTPDGNWVAFDTLYKHQGHSGHRHLYRTRHASTGFGSWWNRNDMPLMPWGAPQSVTTLANSADPANPHQVIGSSNSWSQGYTGYASGRDPWIFKGASNDAWVTDPEAGYEQRAQPFTDRSWASPNSWDGAGGVDYVPPTPGAMMAQFWDMVSSGYYTENGEEPYRGLICNGTVAAFAGSLFCDRVVNDVTAHNDSPPPSWPLDPLNDGVIFSPLRWDVFGWDDANSTWVKEEWAWDFDTSTWSVDPATVFPGRPCPTGGGTHNLDGITAYPYSGLTLTFEDQRPEASVDPTLGEWSSQWLYNGEVLDGVREYTFSSAIAARPMIRSVINQVIPASGVITIPESFDDRFKSLEWQDYNLHNLAIDGAYAQLDHANGLAGPAAAGSIDSTHHQLVFHPDDVGKTVTGTYVFHRYSTAESPANWCRVKVDSDDIVALSPNDLLGGQAVKDSATLLAEGWTLEGSGNSTHYVSASDYSAQFPTGFRMKSASSSYEVGTSAEITSCERIAFQADAVAWHWTNASTAVGTSNYGNSGTNGPSYGTVQWLYTTSLAMLDVHSRLYTDANLEEWLVIRSQWDYGSGYFIVMELWINVANPWLYEARHGVWGGPTPLFNTAYPGNHYNGIVFRNGSGSGGFQVPTIHAVGHYSIWDYTDNFNLRSHWGGGPENWQSRRWQFNFNNLGFSS